MTYQEQQLDFFGNEHAGDLQKTLDATRSAWMKIRMLHAVGSQPEREAWDAYQEASRRLAAIRREQRP